jgi:hypothetical protein
MFLTTLYFDVFFSAALSCHLGGSRGLYLVTGHPPSVPLSSAKYNFERLCIETVYTYTYVLLIFGRAHSNQGSRNSRRI